MNRADDYVSTIFVYIVFSPTLTQHVLCKQRTGNVQKCIYSVFDNARIDKHALDCEKLMYTTFEKEMAHQSTSSMQKPTVILGYQLLWDLMVTIKHDIFQITPPLKWEVII